MHKYFQKRSKCYDQGNIYPKMGRIDKHIGEEHPHKHMKSLLVGNRIFHRKEAKVSLFLISRENES